ncbi:abhydrolase domain-containing protein abhd-5.2 [Pyrus x bretschneideri]|uniref:abhydrolase domain-containing protein abhd-5.2 n=1 Tax=Pyrus x bretschneideri TaxID=225117 RepID=UPI000511987E|nr:abhydrolase domain-containing protein abhd-5.2 [Pyrus x bretschneideri]
MGSCAGVGVLPPDFSLLKNCSEVSSFRGGNTTISLSFPSRFGSDAKNHTILKSFPVASAASVSGSGGAQYSGSEQLLDVQTKQKRRGIAGVEEDELENPKLLADPDSCFCEFRGVEIHHKVYDAQSQVHEAEALSSQTKNVGFPMILLHGFGASVFSFSRVMKPLAEATGSKVLAFDRPAFGLTSRVSAFGHLSFENGESKPLNPYSMAFAVLATLYFMDFLAAEKAILVGHSAGCLVAVDSYFESPERVAALILISPAIFAPRAIEKVAKGHQPEEDNQTEEDASNSVNQGNPFIQFFKTLSKFTKFISDAVMRLVKGMVGMLNSLYKKFLLAILRSAFAAMLVRMVIDKFGVAGVKNAWYDSKQVTEHVIQGYTKPLRIKGWDKALLEYTAAMLTDTSSESKPPLSKRLREISCPVLIVTGDTDRIVPSWNAKRLSQAIPGSYLEVIKHCGHLPHEEKFHEFVSIVKKFLQTALGDSQEQHIQAVV